MLELCNVSFEVDGKKILNNISLTIEDNRFTVITGPNGGGKSTLAKLIMGIEQPTDGTILFDGEDITAMSIDERAKRKIIWHFESSSRVTSNIKSSPSKRFLFRRIVRFNCAVSVPYICARSKSSITRCPRISYILLYMSCKSIIST